jgi:hypothetical protein
MTRTVAVSIIAPSTSRPSYSGAARLALAALGVVTLLTATPRTVAAQSGSEQRIVESQAATKPAPAWSFLVTSGTVVPTGLQRNAIKRANLTAAQVSYVVRPALALGATVGWARSRDVAATDDAKLDVFTYDIGAEVRSRSVAVGRRLTFSPFAGGGAGARSYSHRDQPIDARHEAAAYVSGGGELGIGRVALRLEVRDYVTSFTTFGGGRTADARNDVVVMTGLRFLTR